MSSRLVLAFAFSRCIQFSYSAHTQGPTFTADTVLGRDGFLVGAEAAYNVTDGRISRYALAAGFNAPEYAVTLHALNDLKSFSASYYHRVSADVEAGAKAIYDPKLTNGGVSIEVGTKTSVPFSFAADVALIADRLL